MTDDTTPDEPNSTQSPDEPTTANTEPTDDRRRSRQTIKDVDHTPPVEGAKRTFERNREGRPTETDGGQPEQTADTDDRPPSADARETMSDVDHTSPVEGAKRTFERGPPDTEVDE